MTSGIYRILLFSGKYYVGHSVNIEQRWYIHRWHLQRNQHHCQQLQNAWNKYGELVFEVLEECSSERTVLLEREQFHMDAAGSLLINASRVASYVEPTPETRKKHSLKAKAQHVAGILGPHTLTPEGKARRSAAVSRALKGRKQRPESVAKMRAACKARWTPELREQQRQRALAQHQARMDRIFGRKKQCTTS